MRTVLFCFAQLCDPGELKMGVQCTIVHINLSVLVSNVYNYAIVLQR